MSFSAASVVDDESLGRLRDHRLRLRPEHFRSSPEQAAPPTRHELLRERQRCLYDAKAKLLSVGWRRGVEVGLPFHQAERLCIRGAIAVVGQGTDRQGVYSTLNNELRDQGWAGTLDEWNDAEGRTLRDVLSLLQAAGDRYEPEIRKLRGKPHDR